MLGFTLNGIHSSNFGVVETVNRQIIPSQKTKFIESDLIDSKIDLSSFNYKKRCFYNSRSFEILLKIKSNSIYELMQKIENAKNWLIKGGTLVFDDTKNRFWEVKIYDSLDFKPQILGLYAELKIKFTAYPFAFSEEKVFEYTSNGSNVLNFINNSTYYTECIIECVGNANTFKVEDFSITTSAFYNTVIINNIDKTVTNSKGKNLIRSSNYNFFELLPQQNSITIYSDAELKIKVKFKEKYL